MEKFKVLNLTINMRLMQSQNNIEQQRRYGELLLAIGEKSGNRDADFIHEDEKLGKDLFGITNLPFIHNEDEAINFIYPNGEINPENAIQRAFLAITNKDVDDWNIKIQNLNPNEGI